MSDLTISDEYMTEEQRQKPPLCLRHYLDEQEGRGSQAAVKKPPGAIRAHVIERRDNVIILEFADAPITPVKTHSRPAGFRRLCRSGWDLAIVLLLLGTAMACVAALVQ